MPHTNRKKKSTRPQQRSKRVEVQDEDGWTRVTTTNSEQRRPWPASIDGHKLGGILEDDWKPVPPEPHMTLEKLEAQYRDIEKRWKESESWRQLDRILRSNVDKSMLEEIDNCVVFGTGSYCGLQAGWIERFEIHLYQLAAFKTLIDTIEDITNRRPPAWAQEPLYNEMDIGLMSRLQVQTATDPQGFELLSRRSLFYAPTAELAVELQALSKNTAVALLSSRLDFVWRNEKQEACTNRVYVPAASDQRVSDQFRLIHEIEDDATRKEMKEQYKDELEEMFMIIEQFKKDKQCFTLPNLDAAGSPFRNEHLFVRNDGEAGSAKIDTSSLL